jgi:phosphoribosylformimino-5-aminoimidazole carboxamide ribotide isomerase
MLIPSIDLMGGRVVQLEQGERLRVASDDIDYWIERFAAYPRVQLIDLDAAMCKGENTSLVERIARRLPVQVGGGIRTVEAARRRLEAGARQVILGSALFAEREGRGVVRTEFAQEIAAAVDAKFVLAGIDSRGGRIAIKGWTVSIALTAEEAMTQLDPFVEGYLYTHIDGEGLLQGFPLETAERLRVCTRRRLIVAGGIRSQSEIDALDAMGVDAVAGMAIYTNLLKA